VVTGKPPLAARRPYLFAILVTLGLVTANLLGGLFASLIGLHSGIYKLSNSLMLAYAAWLIMRLGGWTRAGFRAFHWSHLWMVALAFLPAIVNLAFGVRNAPLSIILSWLVVSLSAAVVEEGIYRGLILHALLPRGAWRAAIISAGLFSLAHGLNVFAGYSPAYVLLQVAYTFAIGFCFAAMLIRGGSLWPLVLAHTLINFAGFLAQPRGTASGVDGISVAITIAYVVIFTAWGIYLLAGFRQPPVSGVIAKEDEPFVFMA
jgi:membrane protease YdiL (CAAX protease family)